MYVDETNVLRRIRKKKKINISDLAKKTGICPSTISLYENGKPIEAAHLQLIIEALNTSPEAIGCKPIDEQLEGADFSTKLRHYRRLAGLTQKELANALNKRPSTISDYENGFCRPSFTVFNSLAVVLGVSASDLADQQMLSSFSGLSFAKKLTVLRKMNHVSKAVFADAINISVYTVTHIEQQEIQPSLLFVEKTAKFFNVSFKEMYGSSFEDAWDVLPLYERIRYCRKKQNMTQRELAEKAQISFNTIILYESVHLRYPTLRVIERLAKALCIDENDLYGDKTKGVIVC